MFGLGGKLFAAKERTNVRKAAVLESFLRKGMSNCTDPHPIGLQIHCPLTMGRVLVANPETKAGVVPALPNEAERQQPHYDFEIVKSKEKPLLGSCPSSSRHCSFFTMCTGEVCAALRVNPCSHRWSHCHASIVKAYTAISKPDLIWIPPFSMMIMRGDL